MNTTTTNDEQEIDRDACERPEERPQLPKAVSFADMLAPMMAEAEARQRAREQHIATCTNTPCVECGRHLCRRCRKPAPDYGLCVECALDDELAAARVSVPKRFRWAIDADRDTLIGTAKRLRPVVVDSGLAWARSATTTGLVLRGDPGLGKTSLVVALFGAWLRVHRDPTARFVEAFELAQARSRHPLGQGEAPLVDAAVRASLLVLDDLGSEQGARAEVISDVLLARHNVDAPTWVTSWLPPDEMSKRYGGGVCRRVFEGAKVVAL